MPPPGAPRPDGATYAAVTAHLENALDSAAAANPNPGRVPVHRLNRTEYANAIRDLLGLDIDSRGVLPADDSDQEGFDNVASVLTVSPALLENYLAAARMISRLAVGDTSRKPMVDVFKVERDMVQDERMSEELPFGSRGGTAVTYQFPVDGEYLFKIELKRQLYDYIVGMGEPHQLDVRLDGVLLKRFTVGGEGKGMTTPENYAGNTPGDPEWEKYMLTADRGLEVRAPVKAGPHLVGVSFVRRLWEGGRDTAAAADRLRPHDERVVFRISRAEDRVDRRSVQRDRPGRIADTTRAVRVHAERRGSRRALRPENSVDLSAARAYRRPITEAETQVLLDFYRAGRTEEKTFDAGIQRGLERVLAAPSFIFRVNSPRRRPTSNLASKLSFFLWSSIPDEELLTRRRTGS